MIYDKQEMALLIHKATMLSTELSITITKEGVGQVELSGTILHSSKDFNIIKSFVDGMYFAYYFSPVDLFIRRVFNRPDIMVVGNIYDKRHIMCCCDATEEEATAFLDEVSANENDAVLEDADQNLRTLFEDWKNEREQECF